MTKITRIFIEHLIVNLFGETRIKKVLALAEHFYAISPFAIKLQRRFAQF